MMWLRRAMGLQDMERQPAPSPIENNPVGWSSIYPPPPGQVMENASPAFSPLASSETMTNEQRLGRFWNAATGRARPYTNADLPQLSEAGREAYDMAAGFVNSSQPIRAYHGSPHTFDRFDLSKIGTGEGAQAYGHGLYFAGNEKVARSYRDTLTPPGMRVTAPDGGSVIAAPGSPQFFEPLVAALKDVPAPDYIKRALARAYSEGASDLSAATIKNAFGDMALSADDLARAKQTVNQLVADAKPVLSAFKIERPGSMYEVSLRTTPERLLDWDKPLSQQPAAVREALGKIGVKPEGAPVTYGEVQPIRAKIEAAFKGTPVEPMAAKLADDLTLAQGTWDLDAIRKYAGPAASGKLDDALAELRKMTSPDNPSAWQRITGQDAYQWATDLMPQAQGAGFLQALGKSTGQDVAASQALRQAGLDGIQYLDAGSRAAGEGSRNYVMFRDDIIDILKRYGLFGLGMVGGATAGPYGAQNP